MTDAAALNRWEFDCRGAACDDRFRKFELGHKVRFPRFPWIAAVLVATSALPAPAAAQTESVLYAFGRLHTGDFPIGRPLLDKTGVIYGTATQGGKYNAGVVYELSQSGGAWTETILHAFTGGADGGYPWAGLIRGGDGALYGTADSNGAYENGTAFKLTQSGGTWNLQTIYNFDGNAGGEGVISPLYEHKGALYGTAQYGGSGSFGVAFELSESQGVWSETVLHSFTGHPDGQDPDTSLHRDAAGAFYGATSYGGNGGSGGTIYDLTESAGIWTETVLHTFGGKSDGGVPMDMVLASDGTLYGVTNLGGSNGGYPGLGTAFELKRSHGEWKETIIWNAGDTDADSLPVGIEMNATTGALYVTTEGGSLGHCDLGAVVELTQSQGAWNETLLHDFAVKGDGRCPQSRVVLDNNTGILYGTTYKGPPRKKLDPGAGEDGYGTLYGITP